MKKKNDIALEELKCMLPYILLFNGAAVAVCIVVGLVSGFDWRLYSGLLVGNILMTANFLLIGYTAGRIASSRDFRTGQFLGNLSYGLRYVGLFVILAGLLTLGVISPVTAVIPLIFPKLYYTFFYVRLHGKDE